MHTTSFKHIAHLAEICYLHGVRHIVLSPGSRNAPLIVAFDEHPGIKTWLIHDERSAAFFALGISDALNEPVAIACTSGSAPLNYAPAIAEAYYRQARLLVLTADRPVAWVDQGDGQTIRQKNVFSNYIKASFELPEEVTGSDLVANEALHALNQIPRGPAHINIPLEEPLYKRAEQEVNPVFNPVISSEKGLTDAEKEEIATIWKGSPRKLILIGQHTPHESVKRIIEPILGDPSVAFLVENTSNVSDFGKIVHCIDRTLAMISEQELDQFRPDLLITLGGAIISKKIKAFLRSYKPLHNWRIGHFLIEEDTYQSLTRSWKTDPESFFSFLGSLEFLPETTYGDRWKQKDFLALDEHSKYLDACDFSDLLTFEFLIGTLPAGARLHMGNSSVVRYCQLFNPPQGMRFFSNRGVSGIDGSSSTAAGAAAAEPDKLHVLFSGDISFLYDSNALWNNYLGPNLRIVVINNGGGGIFQFLDGPSSVPQYNYFVSPHQANIEMLCQAFDVNYFEASDMAKLEKVIPAFYSSEGNRPALLEIKTFRQDNAGVLKSYFESIRKSVI